MVKILTGTIYVKSNRLNEKGFTNGVNISVPRVVVKKTFSKQSTRGSSISAKNANEPDA
jgi:hypothetical protein